MRIDVAAHERELIQGLLGSPRFAAEVCVGLRPEHFADHRARPMAEAVCGALREQEPPSPDRVAIQIRQRNLPADDPYEIATPTTRSRLKTLVQIVTDAGNKRLLAGELERIAEQIKRIGEDADQTFADCVEMTSEAITRLNARGAVRIRTLSQIADEMVGKAQEIAEGLRPEILWRTGIKYLDRRFLCGPEQLGLFAADSGHGKTTMLDNFASRVLDAHERLAAGYIPAADMSGADMGAKNIGRLGEVDTNAASGFRRPTQAELDAVRRGQEALKERYGARYYVSESEGTAVPDIEAQVRTLAMMMRDAGQVPGLFIIDYAQAVTWAKARTEFDALKELARRMKALAKALGVCIIIASQLNAEGSRNVNKRGQIRPETRDIYGGSHLKFYATWIAMLVRRDKVEVNPPAPNMDVYGIAHRQVVPPALRSYWNVELWSLKGRFGGDLHPQKLEFCGAHATYYEPGQSPITAWNRANPKQNTKASP